MTAFMTIVGLEGASKSTSIQTIADVFSQHQQRLTLSREPGGTPLAERLRTLHKQVWVEDITPMTEMLMMFASRAQSYHNVVRPALKDSHVILDRSWLCTYAYQVYQLQDDTLFNLLTQQLTKKQPFHAVLFMDVDPEIGLLRARGRGELDRIEQKNMAFFERAREGYRTLVNTMPQAYTIDANADQETVQQRVREWATRMVTQWAAPEATIANR